MPSSSTGHLYLVVGTVEMVPPVPGLDLRLLARLLDILDVLLLRAHLAFQLVCRLVGALGLRALESRFIGHGIVTLELGVRGTSESVRAAVVLDALRLELRLESGLDLSLVAEAECGELLAQRSTREQAVCLDGVHDCLRIRELGLGLGLDLRRNRLRNRLRGWLLASLGRGLGRGVAGACLLLGRFPLASHTGGCEDLLQVAEPRALVEHDGAPKQRRVLLGNISHAAESVGVGLCCLLKGPADRVGSVLVDDVSILGVLALAGRHRVCEDNADFGRCRRSFEPRGEDLLAKVVQHLRLDELVRICPAHRAARLRLGNALRAAKDVAACLRAVLSQLLPAVDATERRRATLVLLVGELAAHRTRLALVSIRQLARLLLRIASNGTDEAAERRATNCSR
eukprot:scaffold47884_cov69-Phaeocystis_antarctica.AAC.1